jgi:hypothetical protein
MSPARHLGPGALAVVLIAGCGTNLQPAGGKVLVDGVPVTEGTIMFYPVAKGRPATGRIVQDGSFTLSYAKPGDGLPPGEYKVAIVADLFKPGPRTAQQAYDEANMKRQGIEDTSAQARGTLIHVVPPEYNDVTTTPLKQTVKYSSDPQIFVFDIPVKNKK